jgi:hypothetical protein
LTSATISRAEEVDKKFRLGVSLGGFSTADEVKSASANRRTLFEQDGSLDDRIFDPRNDSAAFSSFGIQSQLSGEISASYAFTRLFYVEGSVGYRRGDVGNVEVQAQFSGVQPPINQDFDFNIFNYDAGTMSQIPVQLTTGIRFRPKSSFNPYICVGIGYMFNSYEPSDEIDQLSRALSSSTGGFSRLQGTEFGTETLGGPESVASLTGIVANVPDAPEWHFGGGLEYTFKNRWALFVDARYFTYSGRFGLTVNGSDELGVSVPSDRRYTADPDAFGPFGAYSIISGGLVDGGKWVPNVGAPAETVCTPENHLNCFFTRAEVDGIPDPGYYYVHTGKIRWDGLSLQFGFKYTF